MAINSGMLWKDCYGVEECPECEKFFIAEAGGKPRVDCPWCGTPQSSPHLEIRIATPEGKPPGEVA